MGNINADKRKKVKYGGVWYDSYTELAELLGITTSSISDAVGRYGSDLDAGGYVANNGVAKKCVWYCGKCFERRRDLADYLNVSESMVSSKISMYGDHLDESMFIRGCQPIKTPVWYNGERFECKKDLAQYLGISGATLNIAIAKYGDHLDDSMIHGSDLWIIYKRKRYAGEALMDNFLMTNGEARRLIEKYGHDMDAAGVKLKKASPRIRVSALDMSKTEEEMW